jgi:hypothetical protein
MWTDAAIETLRQMALEGKSASTIAAALGAPSQRRDRQGEPDRRQTDRQHPLLGAPCAAVRHRAAASPGDRAHRFSFMEANFRPRAPARAQAGMGLRGSPGWRDVEGRARGDPRGRLPVANRRPDERGIRLLRRSDRKGPLLLRRTLPDGLQAAEFAGLGRAALRGHRVDGGRVKPQPAA